MSAALIDAIVHGILFGSLLVTLWINRRLHRQQIKMHTDMLLMMGAHGALLTKYFETYYALQRCRGSVPEEGDEWKNPS